MPAFLDLSPGLVIWTLINFSIFAFIIAKFGWKPMKDGLAAREQSINDAISNAEAANAEAKEILADAKARIANSQQEMLQIVRDGKAQADEAIRKATEEADGVKQIKLEEAEREITRQKDEAIKELRSEMATLVITATEKLLGRTMQAEDHKSVVEANINELSKN